MNEGETSNSKWIVCNCNNCSGHLEFDTANAGTTIKCPHCGMDTILFIPPIDSTISSKPKSERQFPILSTPKSAGGWLVAFVLLGIVVWVGAQKIKEFNSLKPETEWQLRRRLRSEAEKSVLIECSNQVVGITRIVTSYVDDTDDDPHKWKAEVTAEYVNHFGGIDQTNVPFDFSIDTDTGDGLTHVYCHYDWQKASGISTVKKALKVAVEGAFGLKLGTLLPSDCQVFSSKINDHDGYILVKLIPPQPNAAFNDYQVELDPNSRLISFISAYGKTATDGLAADTVDGLLEALRQHYGDETSSRTDGNYREYSWDQNNRYIELSASDEMPFLSCWDDQLYKTVKPTIDTKGL